MAVREQLRGIFDQCRELENHLSQPTYQVNCTDTAYLLGDKFIPHSFADELPDLASHLGKALLEEEDLQQSLRKAGLEGLIR